ncbi:hypothetical protein [Gordonia polyisoprenivorans]|uniref:hypothetical protein n=1 Tax=Gordonia polyisoprenivorans TaxID=84595 RepID=UPI001AD65462|nr:hypothetical protein [Gordonia polyisoprenivorans]QTI67259.1 hypothetical protein J6U32_16715 [Gordonia polyisoprenivorans]
MFRIEDIACPSVSSLQEVLATSATPFVTRQQGATEVSCYVEIPGAFAFSLLSFENRDFLRYSVLPVLEERSHVAADRSDGRTTTSTVRAVDGLGDEAFEMATRFDHTNDVLEISVWSRTGAYRVNVVGGFPDSDVALRVARLWLASQPK